MEGRGRSRRHSPQREWKRRLSSVLAVVLTVVMVLNMPLSIDGLGLRISNAFASGNGTGQDSVWATASNAKYKQGDSKDVDIYVIAEDNGVVPGNTSSMTLYLKNNTDQEITEGVLTFKGKYINKEDVTFQDIGAGEIFDTVIAGGGPGTPSQDTAESAEDSAAGAAAFPEASGEGLLYQEVQGTEADGNDAALMDDGNGAALIDDDNDAEPAGDDFDAENGNVEENDEDEEEPWKLEEIDLQPGELHEIHFEFYTEEDIKSTKANVTFSFRGENEEGSRVESSTKFYYSIGLPTVNFSMEDGMQIESGVSNDLEIWMSEPDWVDEDLEEKLLEQEEKKEEEEMKDDEEDAAGGTESETASDSEASKDALKASNSNASKNETASDSNADKDNSNTVSQEDEEKIDKYTQEAMEISESRVNYTVEIFGAKVDLHARKTVEAEDIGWISCVYEVDTNTEPGIYYGKVTASGKWNKKDFTSEQGFLFEVTGEGKDVYEFEKKLEGVIVHISAERGVLPRDAELRVVELKEDNINTQEEFLKAKDAVDAEGVEYDGLIVYDISFFDKKGNEIEPDGMVSVSMEINQNSFPKNVDFESVKVQHLSDSDNVLKTVADSESDAEGTIEKNEDNNIVAEFAIDGFSPFPIPYAISAYAVNSVSIRDDILNSGSLIAEIFGEGNPESVTYQWYQSETGTNWVKIEDTATVDSQKAEYYVARDGARKWFRVGVTDTEGKTVFSAGFHVKYYDSLQNGSFEYPAIGSSSNEVLVFPYGNDQYVRFMQVPNGTAGLEWKTSVRGDYWGSKGPDYYIEIADGSRQRFQYYGRWVTNDPSTYKVSAAAEGNQFAELNCEQAGALYQDVLTQPGAVLKWGLEHAGRGSEDTMIVVISDTNSLPDGWNPAKKDDLQDRLDDIQAQITSDGAGKWSFHQGTYEVPEKQYVTRFYFVAANGSADGNLLDNISFGKEVPNPPEKKGNLLIEKSVDGIEQNKIPAEAFDFEILDSQNQLVKTIELPTADGKWSQAIDLDPGVYTVKEVDTGTSELEKLGYQYVNTTYSSEEGNETSGSNVEVSIVAKGKKTIKFTNYYSQNVNLTIEKKVTGNLANDEDTFKFKVFVNGELLDSQKYPIADGTGSVSVTDGVFIMEAGKPVIISNLPSSAAIVIQETDVNGYNKTEAQITKGEGVAGEFNAENRTFTIANLSKDVTVEFTNTKQISTPTGIINDNYTYLLMLAVASVSATSFIYPVYRRRRRRRDR